MTMSAFGTKRTLACALHMSAFGCKAHMTLCIAMFAAELVAMPVEHSESMIVTKTPLSDFGPGLYDFRVLSGEGRT